ncbi:MAG TPA: DUF4097 family beta strand repeat-containing protein [Terriglobales bacterium]|nr:DUF4097 family beta strand repeat-containing protein [Terriglobales bacterium]
MKSTVVFALSCAAALWVAACPAHADDVVGSFHRTFKVSGAVRLDVSTGSGSISIARGEGKTVMVDATIRQSDDWFASPDMGRVKQIENNPPVEQTGDSVVIHNLRQGVDFGWGDHLSISYVITTPANTQVRAHSGSGAIDVSGITGGADLEAGSGHLQVSDLGGNLRAETGSGRISFDRVSGDARLSTGSGSIEGNEVGGRLSASTGSGRINVRRLDNGGDVHTASGGMELDQVSGDLEARASSGTIRVGGDLVGAHRWDVSTSSGAIQLSLPSQTVADVRLDTGSGGIYVNHPVRVQGRIERHHWEGVMGDGAGGAVRATLDAHAGSGSIHVN